MVLRVYEIGIETVSRVHCVSRDGDWSVVPRQVRQPIAGITALSWDFQTEKGVDTYDNTQGLRLSTSISFCLEQNHLPACLALNDSWKGSDTAF
jgi:hypothetical protein